MQIYNINGDSCNVYDVNGNEIVTASDSSVGYVTEPEYITIDNNVYRLVWHDEFKKSDIDKNFWSDTQFINTKQKRYQSWSDYYISDDKLHLLIKSDAPDCFLDNPENDVAQSIIMTGQHNNLHIIEPSYHDVNPIWNFLVQEGYWEFRFKVFKSTGGCHTAIWTAGIQDGENSLRSGAEIDVTEILGRDTTSLPHGLHQNGDTSVTEIYHTTPVNIDFATDFHTVGFLWENGVMKWWVDGTLVDVFSDINTPQYPMILLLAAYKRIRGTGWTGDADTTLGDVEFIIDYARIYKKASLKVADTTVINNYTPIIVNANTQNTTIDDERGCPMCFPSYVYINWNDGTRTEHWVKWDAVKDTYRNKLANHNNFDWSGYVYGHGIKIIANVIMKQHANFSILGDSYSMNNPTYNGVTNDTMWWKLFEQETGIALDKNNSISGSCVAYDGYDSGTDDQKTWCFLSRLDDIGNPDLIFIFGGTNDYQAQENPGELIYSDWTESDKEKFSPAYAYMVDHLIKQHPDATIISLVNFSISIEFKQAIYTICNHYGIPYIELTMYKANGHPTINGMRQITNQIKSAMNL